MYNVLYLIYYSGFGSYNQKNDSFSFSNHSSVDNGQGPFSPGSMSSATTPVAKPKKFFKSRNAIPEPESPHPSSSTMVSNQSSIYGGIASSPLHTSTDKLKIKINKGALTKTEKTRKPKTEKVKPEKPVKEKVVRKKAPKKQPVKMTYIANFNFSE